MITIYSANAADFSTLGLGALSPSACTIEEQAGGLYEMTLTQPITDDLKHTLIAQGRIIKAPAPVRETPLVEIGRSGSVTRRICKVTTDGRRLNMRTAADQSARVIHAYRPGTEVAVTGESGSWSSVIILDGGASGWMWTANLTFVREESETISGDAPGSVIMPRQTREQLFRICEVETDGERRAVTARAQHISYDLKGAIVAREYAPENVSAEAVCAAMMGYIDHETPFRLICTVTEPVTIDCTGRNILDIIMDRDSGLLAQTGARLIRDNYDLFILPDEARDRGVSLRYGKNLLSAALRTDASGLITRIQPAGKAKDGETLLISDDPAQSFVDSARIGDYPAIYAKRVEYDVVEGKDLTKAEAREKLREKALSDFDAGCDLPSIRLDADFVRLDLTEDYKALANAYALHLYDSVPVTDDAAGIVARARMTGYKYDALQGRYDGTTLGELTDANVTVYGDEIGGGLSGTKIIPGSMNGDRLRNLSVNYAKISRAAVDQLSADSLTAQIAHINALTAGTIDADELTAAWAKLYTIIAENIEAGTIEAGTITAAMAKLSDASIQRADIDFAQVKQMKAGTAVADQLITHDAVADRYFIDKLQVRALQVLEQTVGSLTVKASDGSYYRLDIDPEAGTVVPTPVTLSDDEKAAGVTGDKSRCIIETDLTVSDLAASSIKAINALIDKLTASRIEVDTLFAREATVGALDAYLVRASTIEALEGQLNVWANEKVNLAVGALAIGGTNLALNTDTLNADKTVAFGAPAAGSTTIYNTYDGAEYSAQHAIRVNFTAGGTGANIYWHPSYSPALLNGHTYTWQIKAYIADKASGLDVDMGLEAGGLVLKHLSWSWHTFSHTFVYDSSSTYKAFHLNGNFSAGDKVFLADFKIEEGTKASAWTRNPDEQNQIKIGSSILMDAEHTEISTPYLDIDVSGTDGDTHIDENGISTGTASFEKLNCPEIVKRVAGRNITITSPSGLQAEFDRLNGGMVDGYETITLACDQYGDVTLRGMYGNYTNLTINGGYAINGKVTVVDCHAALINFDNLTINCTTKETVAVHNSSYVRFGDCTLNSSSTHDGIVLYGGAMVMMYNCGIYNAANALNLDWGSRLDFLKLKGTAITYLWAKGCVVTGNDSRPSGNYVGQNVISNWSDMATIAIDTGSGVTPPAAVTTSSYTATTTGTYYPSGHWIGDNIIRQGYEGTGSSARKDYGCMWFNAGGLAGKTIKSATLTIKRIAGKGRSGSVTMKLWTTALTGKSGKPTDSLVSMGEIGTIANGETVTVSVPTSAIATIAAGGGLVLYTEETANASGKTYSVNYAHFEGVDGSAPVLTVTYQ